MIGQVVNVFVMIVRRDKDVALIPFPLMRTQERGDGFIAINDVVLGRVGVLIHISANERAEGSDVIFWRVIVHEKTSTKRHEITRKLFSLCIRVFVFRFHEPTEPIITVENNSCAIFEHLLRACRVRVCLT